MRALYLSPNRVRSTPFSITPVPFEWFPEGAWIVALHRFIEVSVGIIVALIVVAVWPERSAIARRTRLIILFSERQARRSSQSTL